MNEAAISRRIDELLELCTAPKKEHENSSVRMTEIMQGTLSVMIAVYGPNSSRVSALDEATRKARDLTTSVDMGYRLRRARPVAQGALSNLKHEIEAGLLGSLEKQISSGVLTDFIQLAHKALEDDSVGAKNVAAVLTAAVFEDTIRRMGKEFAGVMGRDDLEKVIGELKKAETLKAPQLGIALSYLSFRNHALHADWDQIDQSGVRGCLAFVEGLILEHFG